MIEESPVLAPVVVLIGWTLVMWAWMYATRIPAMRKAQTPLDPTLPREQTVGALPPQVRWKADNYNHLMEQPTIFYAAAFVLALTGAGSGINVIFAWFYVILRIIHSVVQATVNRIAVRFTIFSLATLCLIAMTIGAIEAVFD